MGREVVSERARFRYICTIVHVFLHILSNRQPHKHLFCNRTQLMLFVFKKLHLAQWKKMAMGMLLAASPAMVLWQLRRHIHSVMLSERGSASCCFISSRWFPTVPGWFSQQ